MPGLARCCQWTVSPADTCGEKELVRKLNIPSLLARALVARGLTECGEAQRFLTPSLERDWYDPLLIPGLDGAVSRLVVALERSETIAVLGDFDVDGMSSACILTLALRELGGRVHPFIPHRFDEGYGLSSAFLDRVIKCCHPSLIVTVDMGIANAKEVEQGVDYGLDFVITDHHEPSNLVPHDVPVCDPKLEIDNPSRDLAGVGVVLKLICELGRRLDHPHLWRRYIDVAALGTVSDMMALTGENRSLVAEGMAQMRKTERLGLRALAEVAHCDLKTTEAEDLPFSLIPRLNAAGRMGEADVAFNLLLTDDLKEAERYARDLEALNQSRRVIETDLTNDALRVAETVYKGGPCVIVAGEGWHEGVKGIVASRLSKRYHVPAILCSITDGVAHGSGRSVGSINLFQAVEECSDCLLRFGGHASAVGVTLEVNKLDTFRARLEEVLSRVPVRDFSPVGEVSGIAMLREVSCEAISSLDLLRPFGQGNPQPLFAACGVTMRGCSCVGQQGDHVSFTATDGVDFVPAICFRDPDPQRSISYSGAVDLIFRPAINDWQGRKTPELIVRDILWRDDVPDDAEGDGKLVDELFERAPEIVSRDEYAGIGETTSFATKIVGVTYGNRQDLLTQLCDGDVLTLVRECDNPADTNAIALFDTRNQHIGYLRRQIAAVLAPIIDAGAEYTAQIIQVTGGDEGRAYGANIRVERVDQPLADEGVTTEVQQRMRDRFRALPQKQLVDELRHALIGDHNLLPAQAAALERLSTGHSVLCVMATGRGKSLIFHMHAALTALVSGKASIFVYPLRALVNDQAFHLTETFERFGMNVRVLTGETASDARDEIFSAFSSGEIDILLTTPEFLALHTQRFATGHRVGFVVVDEAHHAGTSQGGNRGSYQDMPRILRELDQPVALAVSATAATPIAREICRLLSIDVDNVIVDETVRTNLSVIDGREVEDRDSALIARVATGEKCVIYVNSREQTIALARMLRKAIGELAPRIAFYNAGLSRAERSRVEAAFRDGRLMCIVSTSAFGEGVNLPDIRTVVLYHMPFGDVEFNQMAGRAGRDGAPSSVYMLFDAGDARINEHVLNGSAPSREELVALYRCLRTLAKRSELSEAASTICMSNADIATCSLEFSAHTPLDDHVVSSGIAIFRELGFLTTSGYGSARRIHMDDKPKKMDLDTSIRYLEGIRSRESFRAFCDFALAATKEELLARVNRPILPEFGQHFEGD